MVRDDVEAGRRIVAALDKEKFRVSAALWLYATESGWRLIIASPIVAQLGPIRAYNRLQTVLREHEIRHPSLNDIALRKPDDDLIRLLRGFIRTGPGIHETRFTRNVVGGVLIEDALIYRIV